jgi:ferredoxin-NADP reductase
MIQRTRDVKSFRFPKPSSFSYKPGQFMFITIRAGQQEMTKHFTISSSPTEKDYVEFTKKLTGSSFSNALVSLKVGDWARIDGPYGNFTFEGEYERIGMLSGGIGITPLRSMCKYCTDMRLGSQVTLLYGNRSEDDIVFREEFEALQQQNRNFKVVFTLSEPGSSWAGQTGRISLEMIRTEIPDCRERIFFTCGPPSMVEAMGNLLRELGIPADQTKRENFPGY